MFCYHLVVYGNFKLLFVIIRKVFSACPSIITIKLQRETDKYNIRSRCRSITINNQSAAARILNISRPTLNKRLKHKQKLMLIQAFSLSSWFLM